MKITRPKEWWLKKADSESASDDPTTGVPSSPRRYRILTKHGDPVPGYGEISVENACFQYFHPEKPLFMLGIGQSVIARPVDSVTEWVEVERIK